MEVTRTTVLLLVVVALASAFGGSLFGSSSLTVSDASNVPHLQTRVNGSTGDCPGVPSGAAAAAAAARAAAAGAAAAGADAAAADAAGADAAGADAAGADAAGAAAAGDSAAAPSCPSIPLRCSRHERLAGLTPEPEDATTPVKFIYQLRTGMRTGNTLSHYWNGRAMAALAGAAFEARGNLGLLNPSWQPALPREAPPPRRICPPHFAKPQSRCAAACTRPLHLRPRLFPPLPHAAALRVQGVNIYATTRT